MKPYALKDNYLFRKAYRTGRRKSSRTVTVYVLRDKAAGLLRKRNPTKQTLNRVGISASKKVGGAVQRNRAKRLIREAYRQIDQNLGIKKGFLIVIVPRTECTVSKMQDVKRDLTYCLSSLEMLAEPQSPEDPPEPANRTEDGAEGARA